MIRYVIAAFEHVARYLVKLAEKERLAAQAKLTQAAALVKAATDHKDRANLGEKVAAALTDLTSLNNAGTKDAV